MSEMKCCNVLDNLRQRFNSGNAVPVASAKITLEEFHILTEAMSNWTGRVLAMPPRTTYGMWRGLQEAQELHDRVQNNRQERLRRLSE